MEVAFRLVDVFTEVPFAGNQLCVVPDPPPELDAEGMATLTREIGFSETTFVTGVREGGYDVRVFTPDAELPFAGHPTLGTAFTLVSEDRVGPNLVQTSAAGDVAVEVDLAAGAAGLELDDLVEGLPIVAGSTGIPHLMVPLREEGALRRARRDDAGCVKVCAAAEAESLYLFTVRGEGDVIARMFDRGATIAEDPATGSAVGPLGAYLAQHRLSGMPGRAVVAQGEMVGRPSFLHVDAQPRGDSFSVRVGGGVRIVGDGSFRFG